MKLSSFAILLTAGLALLTTACSTLDSPTGNFLGGKTATIPQSLLGSVPCVTREAEAQFGVTPEVVEDTARWIVYVNLNLPPAAGKPVRVRYELVSPDGSSTRVRYRVEAPRDGSKRLELDAFDPIERCAGTRK